METFPGFWILNSLKPSAILKSAMIRCFPSWNSKNVSTNTLTNVGNVTSLRKLAQFFSCGHITILTCTP